MSTSRSGCLYTSLTLNLKVVDRFMRESAVRTSRSSCLDAGSVVIGQKFDNCLDGYPFCQLQAITSWLKGRIVWLLIQTHTKSQSSSSFYEGVCNEHLEKWLPVHPGSMVIGQKFGNCLDGYPLFELQVITSRSRGRIFRLIHQPDTQSQSC